MSGYVDLHCHLVPGVDDGVGNLEESLALCRQLAAVGFSRCVTTPHIRRGMFDNTPGGLREAFASLREALLADPEGMPEVELSAEHHLDSLFWELHEAGALMPYPGGKSLLIEFAYDAFPIGVEQQVFRLTLSGCTPALAHPERYRPAFKRSDGLARLLAQGLVAQLDVMSLTGHYGRAPKKAAERMLEEGLYGIACSDAHRPEDAAEVGRALGVLFKRAGESDALRLLRDNPLRLLAGKPLLG